MKSFYAGDYKNYFYEIILLSAYVFQISASTISSHFFRSYFVKMLADFVLLLIIFLLSKRQLNESKVASDGKNISNQENYNKSFTVINDLFLLIRKNINLKFLVVIVFPLLTLLYSENPHYGFQKWINILIGPVISIFATIFIVSTWNNYRLTAAKYLLVFTGILLSLFAVIINPFSYTGNYSITNLKWSYAIYSRYLSSALILLFIFLIQSKNRKELLLFSLGIILTIPGIYFASLRAALLGLAVIIPILLIAALFKKVNKKNIAAAGFAIVIAAITTFTFSQLFTAKGVSRIGNIAELKNPEEMTDEPFMARYEAYNISLERIYGNPVFGLGFGGFRDYYKSDVPLWIKYPHNIFLETQVELGIPGTLLLLYLLYLVAKRSYKISPYLMIFFLFPLFLALFSKDLPSQSLLWIGLGLAKND